MKIGHLLLAGAVLLGTFSTAGAKDSVAEWIAKLSSRSYIEREKAAAALEKIGAAAMPHLEKLQLHGDLETRRRAAMIWRRIEDRLLRDEFLTATPLRLRVNNLALPAALQEIERQSGLACGNVADKERTLKLDTGVLPYWQAWGQFCRTAQIVEADYAPSTAKLKLLTDAALVELGDMLGRRDFDVPLKYAVPRMEFGPKPDYGNYAVDDRHSIRVRAKWLAAEAAAGGKPAHAVFAFEVRAEPRLEIVGMPKVEIAKIVDAEGKALAAETLPSLPPMLALSEHADFLSAFAGEVQFGGLVHQRLVRWPYPARPLQELHGQIRIDILARPRLLQINNVLAKAGKEFRTRPGITLKIVAAERMRGTIRLNLVIDHVETLTPKTLEQQVIRVRPGVIAVRGAMDVAIERLQLLDQKEVPYRCDSHTYMQRKDGKGHDLQLVYTVGDNESDEPSLVMNEEPRPIAVQMPFTVRDVAVPRP